MGDSPRNDEAASPVRSDAFLRTVIDSISEAIAVIDVDGVIVLVNDARRKSFAPVGPQPDPPAPLTDVGANCLGAWEDAIRRDSSGGSARTALDGIKAVLGGSATRFDLEYPCHSSEQQRWFSMRVTPLNLGSRPGATITQVNITERKRMEGQVRHLAFLDQLTDLPNRRLLSERLSHAIAANRRLGCHGAVMFVDLDDFKSIDDALGHQGGDLLLVEAAARLMSRVRKRDTVARFDGDEFVVLIGELDADRSESTKEVRIIAAKLHVAMARPYSLRIRRAGSAEGTVERECTASIGVALFDRDDDDQDGILGRADSAMYEAKVAGCNLIRFHDPAT